MRCFHFIFLIWFNFSWAQSYSDQDFVDILSIDSTFVLDIKYASEDNFLNTKVYDCPKCILKYKTIKKLLMAKAIADSLGFQLKLFDCYRPLSVQKMMWEILPNPVFVANPSKGSVHNRGGAVDLTLIDTDGNEIDMGTPFDYFGKASAHHYTDFSEDILANRLLLKKIMINSGFLPLASEWWHYNLPVELKDDISDFKWSCD
jgi:zinc D-Ala-D-Ala dipeptidase